MGEEGGVFGKPGPVDAIEDGVGKLVDVAVLEMLAAGEHAAEQHRGIDGRNLGIPHALAGIDVGEMEEEAAMGGQLVPDEGK